MWGKNLRILESRCIMTKIMTRKSKSSLDLRRSYLIRHYGIGYLRDIPSHGISQQHPITWDIPLRDLSHIFKKI